MARHRLKKKAYEYDSLEDWAEAHFKKYTKAVLKTIRTRGSLTEEELDEAMSQWWLKEILVPSMARDGIVEVTDDGERVRLTQKGQDRRRNGWKA